MVHRTGWLAGLLLAAPMLFGQGAAQSIATELQDEGVVQDTLVIGTDLFKEARPLHLTLALNLKDYRKAKYREDYVPVELSYQLNDTLSLSRSVRIKARGYFRKQYCQLAPFWLNIKDPEAEDSLSQQVNKVKIVTHCRSGTQYDNYVLKEYLAYKIFNLISPVSFRVRLIRMTYIDRGKKDNMTEHWAFMIEPEEVMAERLNGLAVKRDDLAMRYMEPRAMALVDLFMYMMGNADYSVTGRHNIKILGLEGYGSRGYTPVPYDFDYSGFVNTYYAVPPENLNISSVRERCFMGLCREEALFQEVVGHLESCREEILELIRVFEYLDEKEKEDMIGFLESYFAEAASPQFISGTLEGTCRK